MLELPTRPVSPISLRVEVIENRSDGYAGRFQHLLFIVSEGMQPDGRWWIHASVSRTDKKIPSYDDLRKLKEMTIGEDRIAIQVFPPKSRHIDIAGNLPRPVQVYICGAPRMIFCQISGGSGRSNDEALQVLAYPPPTSSGPVACGADAEACSARNKAAW